jgi:EmrB/QacA subfamily drug resistance transporter
MSGATQVHELARSGGAPNGRPGRSRRTRPAAILALICGAQFMVVLDIAIVNVAIPAMQADLGVAQSDLQWVVVAYGVTLGGFLLLGGRAADLLGRRNVLVAGLGLFAAASLSAGLAGSLGQLVVSRAVQGMGAALAAPAALSILTGTFPEGPARTRALGVFGAVAGTAASVGVIAGGLLTDGPGWEWIFFMNVPIGVALVALIVALIPAGVRPPRVPADLLGAVTVTGGLLAVVYAINQGEEHGWTAGPTLGFLAGGVALLALFVLVERRAASPLVPLSMFRRRTLTAANLGAALVFGAFFATIFQATLFMQQVLGYSAVATGVAWLSETVFALVVAAVVAPRAVERFGSGVSLIVGQGLSAAGLLYLARVPVDASYWVDLAPAFVALGAGLGLSLLATGVAAFIGVEERVAGLAGGMLETAREIGGAVGVAIVATVAIARAEGVVAEGAGGAGVESLALTEGFQRGSLVAAGFSLAGAVVAGLVLRRAERAAAPAPVPAPTVEPTPDPTPGPELRQAS